MAHGKRIEIEDLDDPPHTKALVAKRARRQNDAFTLLPLQWAADTAKAARTPGAMVWILLVYMAWKAKSWTFPLSNTLLTQYGVARETKRRILTKLEAAGRIKIEHRHKRAPIVTLIGLATHRSTC
jgi:hypothetical protein